ncbi:hypothetical protein GMD78_20530 [Ornithinibacillus sp. L9]|uniref:Uncharacterized protein n=1 Tax=Ornithinibacillus caprae TaxID=2678566 RepID=A0A6N8FP99_9BACI|nr:hypothetical protein [Ornithinibacillus caprae]MUK90746.1 hypothetical protein [Ornithinibacillus caprae]
MVMYLVVILFTFPIILVLWSFMDVKNGKREKINWKPPLILFSLLTVVSIIIQLYLLMEYRLPLFLNTHDSMIVISLIGLLLGIIALINIVITLRSRKKNVPKEVHNSKTVWKIIGVFGGLFALFLFWFMPLGDKVSYVWSLHDAINAVEDTSDAEEFSLVLVRSEPDCLSYRNCSNLKYDNQFYVKNNMDEVKEVQFKIRALNEDQEELKVIDSTIMRIEPGELLFVETEETNDKSSVWDKYSFKTEESVYYFQHQVRYRDPE